MRDARAMIIAPLHIDEQVLGALSLSSSHPAAFSETNLRLLVSFAATTTAALQNAILHAEVKRLAVLDPLTGLYNRRAFFDLGQREVERFLRFNHPLSAVMIDLDNFKEVNDTFGHAAGDQILRSLAGRVRETIRETDVFGRYGGDEFILLLPDTDLEAAMHIAGRIHASFTDNPWVTDHGVVPVAASLGVARAGKQHRLLENLLADADQALYRAKMAGRSRVEIFSSD
jgi:diguanylate cyclase (GGDEF)-like protein